MEIILYRHYPWHNTVGQNSKFQITNQIVSLEQCPSLYAQTCTYALDDWRQFDTNLFVDYRNNISTKLAPWDRSQIMVRWWWGIRSTPEDASIGRHQRTPPELLKR